MSAATLVTAEALARISRGRRQRQRRRRLAMLTLTLMTVAAFVASLMFGHTNYGLGEVIRVVAGETVPGATFTVGELRLPRAVLALLSGAAFGMAGSTFQTMLRNALASPDIIGISSGAGAAAVFALLVLHLNAAAVSFLAVIAGLATALLIYLLAYRDGLIGTRLILIGIGIAAMLDSVISYLILKASQWDLPTAMRWLTGSLNDAGWGVVLPLAIAFLVAAPMLLSQSRDLQLLHQGDDVAAGLGVRVERTRLLAILTAVCLVAFATAASGPIAFVAFLAGPIAARIIGPGTSLLIPAALVGALLVLLADFVGQYAFGARYPVGVITGALGAPYLVYLLIRSNRSGGSL